MAVFPRLNRKEWAVSPHDVGPFRLAYLAMVGVLVFFLLLYVLFGIVLNDLDTLTRFFGGQGGLADRYSPVRPSVLFLAGFLGFVLLVAIACSVIIRRPNVSWYWVQALGDGRLRGFDVFLVVFGLILVIPQVIGMPSSWLHVFVAVAAIGGSTLNLISKRDPSRAPVDMPRPEDTGKDDKDGLTAPSEALQYRDFNWTCDLGDLSIEQFPIPQEEYDRLKKVNDDWYSEHKGSTRELYRDRIVEGITPTVKSLVARIFERHAHGRNIERLDSLLQFVHSLPYAPDKETTGHDEYARFPTQTLYEGKGDCECLSILLCALFKVHGYDTALILVDSQEGRHCMSGVRVPEELEGLPGEWVQDDDGRKYFFCEATGEGWKVGQKSEDQRIEKDGIIPL